MTKLIFLKAINYISGSAESKVTKGGVNFRHKVLIVSAEAMKSIYLIQTRTALKTTAGFA